MNQDFKSNTSGPEFYDQAYNNKKKPKTYNQYSRRKIRAIKKQKNQTIAAS